MDTEILERVRRLFGLFQEGKIPHLHEHEVNPGLSAGSRENYLYFTLPVCINFQRNSPALWKSALATYMDTETNYLFFPEKIAQVAFEHVQADLCKHKLALQKHKHTEIWTRLANTFHTSFENDPRKLLQAENWDVTQIKQRIQVVDRKLFPYLSGPKMTNYWLYILSCYTDIQLTHMEEISIIPDTHVLQASQMLGLSDSLASPQKVAEIWRLLLQDSGFNPVQLPPVLWNWSRNNFQPRV